MLRWQRGLKHLHALEMEHAVAGTSEAGIGVGGSHGVVGLDGI